MEKQRNEINEKLQNINWAGELRFDKNNVNLFTDFLLKNHNRFQSALITNFK